MQPAASVDRGRRTSVHFRLRDLAGTPTPRRSGESQLIRRRGARRITSSRNLRSAFRFFERINRSIRDREIARSYRDHVDRTRQPHAFPLEVDKSLSMARLIGAPIMQLQDSSSVSVRLRRSLECTRHRSARAEMFGDSSLRNEAKIAAYRTAIIVPLALISRCCAGSTNKRETRTSSLATMFVLFITLLILATARLFHCRIVDLFVEKKNA